MPEHRQHAGSTVIVAIAATILLAGMYTAGYLGLGRLRYGMEIDRFGNEVDFELRLFKHRWQSIVFAPGTHIESACKGLEVKVTWEEEFFRVDTASSIMAIH